MATLIPALGTCVARMTSGERRLAERLEQKLEGDYLLWYDVPVGPKQTHPDFVVLHPRRGALVLETKDWRLDTIRKATRQYFDIAPDGQPKTVMNPLAQARHCAIEVVNALERDPQLVQAEGRHQGKLAFPWGHGVVFTRITRKQFDAAGLGEAIEPHRALSDAEAGARREAERVLYVVTVRAAQRLMLGAINPFFVSGGLRRPRRGPGADGADPPGGAAGRHAPAVGPCEPQCRAVFQPQRLCGRGAPAGGGARRGVGECAHGQGAS